MYYIDLFGHLGYILLLLGMILIRNKSKWGWILRLAGESIWIVLGIIMGISSIWFWSAIFAIIDGMGYFKWDREVRIATKGLNREVKFGKERFSF